MAAGGRVGIVPPATPEVGLEIMNIVSRPFANNLPGCFRAIEWIAFSEPAAWPEAKRKSDLLELVLELDLRRRLLLPRPQRLHAAEAVHEGHLRVHKHKVKGAAARELLQPLLAVRGDTLHRRSVSPYFLVYQTITSVRGGVRYVLITFFFFGFI